MEQLRLTLAQVPLVWEDASANLEFLTRQLDGLETDIVLLPEMFTSGFTMRTQSVAQTMDGGAVQWMKTTAAQNGFAMVGSLVIEESGNFFNRLLFVEPNGKVSTYDKRHLFSFAGENAAYTAGRDRLVVEYKGWKIFPLVCYDLRFPVFSRNDVGYDLLIYVANWPAVRTEAWDALLKARAIENLSYVAAVNRVGRDENGHEYIGHSQVIDPMGKYIATPYETQGLVSVTVDRENIVQTRQKFRFLDDRDEFTVKG